MSLAPFNLKGHGIDDVQVYKYLQNPASSISAQWSALQLAQRRQTNIANFRAGALIAAPAWVATTAYVAGNSVTIPTGQVITCTTAGTSGASAPVYSSTVLAGRPLTDGSVTWYGSYEVNGIATDVAAPTVTTFNSAAAAGLTETILGTTVINSAVTPFGAFVASPFNNGCVPYAFANGASATGGNATSAATFAGYSAAYAYNCYCYDIEFYITDSVVGVTFGTVLTSALTLEIDGVLLQANSPASNGTQGFCVKVDYNGIVKRRLVRFSGSTANVLRGVGLTTIGYIEPSDSPKDSMLMLGDSLLETVVPSPTKAVSFLASLLKRYLGLSAAIDVGIGGTGYSVGSATGSPGYSVPMVLQNPVNQTLFSLYSPSHILFAAGFNDRSNPWSTVGPLALGSWQLARSLFPAAKITIIDGFSESSGPDANALTQAANLAALFATWGDANSRFVRPVGTAVSTAYIQGTGNAGAALSAGNASVFVGTDTTHPTFLGADYLAKRLAYDINVAWNGNY